MKIMLWNDGGELCGFGSSLIGALKVVDFSVQCQRIDITDPTVYHKLLSAAWRCIVRPVSEAKKEVAKLEETLVVTFYPKEVLDRHTMA